MLLYETGHIPGAVKIDWHTDLNDPVVRDYVDGERFAALLGSKGISRDTTVVIYGDKNNWWAAYALWVFTLFGHEDVRLLDGGRDQVGSPRAAPYTTDAPDAATPSSTPSSSATTRPSAPSRTTCSPTSATRSSTSAPPRSTSASAPPRPPTPRRAPCAPATSRPPQNVPWARAAAEDGTFKPRAELDAIYRDGAGLQDGDDVIAYCRIGERSSHTWFVLTHLLGFESVRNYDGSWTEWGSAVRVPIVNGAEPARSRPLIGTGGPCRTPWWENGPMDATTLPARLAEIREDFLALERARSAAAAARVLERAARAARALPRPPRPASSGSRSASRRCSSSSRSSDGRRAPARDRAGARRRRRAGSRRSSCRASTA